MAQKRHNGLQQESICVCLCAAVLPPRLLARSLLPLITYPRRLAPPDPSLPASPPAHAGAQVHPGSDCALRRRLRWPELVGDRVDLHTRLHARGGAHAGARGVQAGQGRGKGATLSGWQYRRPLGSVCIVFAAAVWSLRPRLLTPRLGYILVPSFWLRRCGWRTARRTAACCLRGRSPCSSRGTDLWSAASRRQP